MATVTGKHALTVQAAAMRCHRLAAHPDQHQRLDDHSFDPVGSFRGLANATPSGSVPTMHQQTASAHGSASGDFGNAWMMLIDAVEKLSAAHEPDALARTVVDAARRLCGADGACFVLRDGDLCHYVDEDAIAPIWKGGRFPVSACIAGWCMLNRETAIVPDIDRDDRIPHDMYRTTFVRSLVMVPVAGEDPMAAIGVYWAREQAPDAAAVTILEALARSTATALASATRHQTLTKRVDELAALYRLTDKLYSAESPTDTYDAALAAIFSAFSCNRASILLFDDAGVMRFVAWRGLSEHYRATLEGHSPWKPGDRDPEAIFVTDIDATDEPEPVKAVIRGEGIRGLAFIPLVSKGTVVGKFLIYYPSPHVFVDHEVDLAVTIARQLGFSIERLHAEKARGIAEQELRRSEDLLRLAQAQARLAYGSGISSSIECPGPIRCIRSIKWRKRRLTPRWKDLPLWSIPRIVNACREPLSGPCRKIRPMISNFAPYDPMGR